MCLDKCYLISYFCFFVEFENGKNFSKKIVKKYPPKFAQKFWGILLNKDGYVFILLVHKIIQVKE